jgi:hypothetical protein
MRKRILDKKVFNEAKLYISPDSEWKSWKMIFWDRVWFERLLDNSYNSQNKVMLKNPLTSENIGNVVIDNYKNMNWFHIITLKEPLSDWTKYLKFKTDTDMSATLEIDFNKAA